MLDKSTLSFGLAEPDLQWNENGEPYSFEYDDIYFSKRNGLDETEHVFIEGNRLRQRFAALNSPEQKKSFTIAETGFGTGLNFLYTCSIWDQIDTGDTCLHFISVEKAPLCPEQLQHAFSKWPSLKIYQEALLSCYPERLKGIHRVDYSGIYQGLRKGVHQDQSARPIKLTLLFGDAVEALQQLTGTTGFGIDAWFLDGFSPAKNPDIWTPELFSEIGRLSADQATFSTYTAASAVRRGLEAVGFEIEKRQGFGSKREMCQGVFSRDNLLEQEQIKSAQTNPEETKLRKTKPKKNRPAKKKPWFTLPALLAHPVSATATEKKAIVIGAGLAGCNAAYSLAQRGWKVELIDSGESAATGASGNPQGILYTRFSSTPSSSAEFSLFSYLYAQRFYRTLAEANSHLAPFFFPDDVIQLAFDKKEEQRLRSIVDKTALPENVVRWLSAQQVNEHSGVKANLEGLLFPGGGWLVPSELCATLSSHPNINCRFSQDVATLVRAEEASGEARGLSAREQEREQEREQGDWQVLSVQGEHIAQAPVVIIACAEQSNRLIPGLGMPTKAIRGQVTQIPSNEKAVDLKTVLCTDGYIAPAHEGSLCIGATYNFGSSNPEVTAEDHETNLTSLGQYLPELHQQIVDSCVPADLSPQTLTGRVGFRCTTPDYLPIVGPLPDSEKFLADYAILRKDKTIPVEQSGRYHPGLYTSIGMGSKGLAYAPLCGELLASMICNEPLPVGRTLSEALNPCRFLIRDLIKNRI